VLAATRRLSLLLARATTEVLQDDGFARHALLWAAVIICGDSWRTSETAAPALRAGSSATVTRNAQNDRALAVLLLSFGARAQTEDLFRVTLLGTGTPRPVMERFGPSILVEAGAEVLLFDAGRGSLQRLEQAGAPYARLTSVFLTHLHSDHVVGLPDLWLSGWLVSRRAVPLEVWGPAGTAEMVARLRELTNSICRSGWRMTRPIRRVGD
jgi:hypothetical protein